MNVAEFEHFRTILVEREQSLNQWLRDAGPALRDEAGKVRALLGDIRAALLRVEEGTYGHCSDCPGDVERFRLEVQPARQLCLSCITEAERNLLEDELFLASKIHRALLPQQVSGIDGFEIDTKSLAARVVGGDYYDFLPSPDGGPMRVVIADSMGKGLPAGLVMSNLQGALRILAEDILSPGQLVGKLNHWMCRNIPVTNFVSLACVAVGPGTTDQEHELIHASAGHCPPILVRADGSYHLLDSTGTVIGVHEDFTYDEERLTMSSGDVLLLYTDGVTEAESTHGDMFGDERLLDFVGCNRSQPIGELIDHLIDEVLTFSSRPDFADDFTVIALRKT